MSEQAIFLLVIIIAIAAFDVFLIARKGKKHSISAWTIRISKQYPSIVFIFGMALGFTMGHLFWRMKALDIYECNSPEITEIITYCKE